MFLHGGPGLGDYLESFADEVADTVGDGWTFMRFQQRGLAPSGLEGPFDIATAVDDVRQVVAAAGVDRAVLLGHSWGGHLALHVAVAAPEIVASLVLIDPLGAVDSRASMHAALNDRVGEAARAEAEELMQSGRIAEGFALVWPGYFSSVDVAPPMLPLVFGPEASGGLDPDMSRHFAARTLELGLSRFPGRALFILGRESPIPFEHGERTAAMLGSPDGAVETTVLPTGHFPWIEQPGVVGELVARFLDRR